MVDTTLPTAVILTALPVEYDAVRTRLSHIETLIHQPSGTRIERGRLAGTSWRVALAEIGEGNLTAAALTERIHTWIAPQALFFMGVAGGLKEDINIGDVVVATKVYGIQGGKHTPEGFLVRPDAWRAAHRLEQAARHALRNSEYRVHFKPIAVGDFVLADDTSAISRHLNEHYNDAVAIEMEGAGVAQAAHLTGALDNLIIRGISDKADAHKHAGDMKGSQLQAAGNAASAVLAVLRQLEPTSGVEIVRPLSPARPFRPRRKKALALGAAAVAAISAAAFSMWPDGEGSEHTSKEKKGGVSAAPAPTVSSPYGRPNGPLLVTTTWPTFPECDGRTSVAMAHGGKPLVSFLAGDEDFRPHVATSSGGGTWGAGHLHLTLSARKGKNLVIEDIRPAQRFPKKISPPAWVAQTELGCGNDYGRVFNFNLDAAKFSDQGVVGERLPDQEKAPPNPLGPGFTVSANDPAIIRIDVQACKGNYEWGLRIQYSYDGVKYYTLVGPFRSMSVAGKDTIGYGPDPVTGGLPANDKPGPAPTTANGCPGG
ncbi:5'-methylthioadenosine/S-adenosylhomocysteine nucleosidase family protein [Streptomyces sp. NPDC003388]|uniref:5'-methylthioadenosine/S-adenosylhomocysteine nucleosidase family protein n=1 Tax=Streptomyces sp. ATE26 TaxID=2954237 RepID=UPI00248258DE|nr:5'-methylthioadenosine/S-adenosylhomocysteine nucleosidase [Streptomyces sp. ATE26]MDI1456481.1 5'-methylthioadenosine/S-adenosylhomocysteine nucleosidase [Streptomyces sp. ATE26]